MPVSKRLRYEVLRRDNHACRYCGAIAPDVKLTVDHVVPVALGGTDEPTNLVTACTACNSGKSSSHPDQPLIDDVSEDAVRWSDAMTSAASVLLAARERDAELRQPFLAAWGNWTYPEWSAGRKQDRTLPLPSGWERSVDSILAAGLPMELLAECVDIAMSRKNVDDVFRYMCGCAWNKVAELREIAAAVLIAQDETEQRARLHGERWGGWQGRHAAESNG